MGLLKVVLQNDGNKSTVFLSGHLNEQSAGVLQPLLSDLGKTVIFNFKNVESVNSYGVHAWIGFFGRLKDKSIVFQECTPDVVAQINMIPIFKGNAEVQSVYASYTCEHCGHFQHQLFVKGKNLPFPPKYLVEKVACSKCSKTTTMDVMAEDFFSFMER